MPTVSRTIRIASLIVFVATLAQAQTASTFTTGSRIASVGVLAGGDKYDGAGAGGTVEFGALTLTKRIHLGVGASLCYMRSNKGSGIAKVSLSQIPAYAIGNLHFTPASQPKLDLYAGASVGVTYSRVSSELVIFDDVHRTLLPPETVFLRTRRSSAAARVSDSSTDTGFGIQGGAHFGLTDAISVTAQIGLIDIPLFYGGVSFKF
jgi:opacity protein-like surface antigen